MATVDISTDYLAWDNVEAVTVIVNKNGIQQNGIPIAHALRMDIDPRFTTFGGIRVDATNLRFWIPVAQLGVDVRFDMNAQIVTSDNTKYFVKTAIRRGVGSSVSHWDCLCVEGASED